MPASDLTERQANLLTWVIAWRREHGIMPTVQEMATGLKIKSKNGAQCHLKSLAKKGYVRLSNKMARSTQIIKDSDGKPVSFDIVEVTGQPTGVETGNGDVTAVWPNVRIRLSIEDVDALVHWLQMAVCLAKGDTTPAQNLA